MFVFMIGARRWPKSGVEIPPDQMQFGRPPTHQAGLVILGDPGDTPSPLEGMTSPLNGPAIECLGWFVVLLEVRFSLCDQEEHLIRTHKRGNAMMPPSGTCRGRKPSTCFKQSRPPKAPTFGESGWLAGWAGGDAGGDLSEK